MIAIVSAFSVLATTLPVAAQRPAPEATPPPAKKPNVPAKAAAKPGSTTGSARGGDAQLRQRVEQLEEQLTDMQVTVGTLDSLGRGGSRAPSTSGAAPSGGGFVSGDGARVDSLEMQIRALSSQIEQISARLRALESGGARFASSGPGPALDTPSRPTSRPPARPEEGPGGASGFGTVTVRPGEREDDIGRIIQQNPGRIERGPARESTVDGLGARAIYDRAYNFLLQQDYGAAEAAFEDFLTRFPHEPLAGSAQYWLGESLFVRGEYRTAASMFLKGYQTHVSSPKAPDSLLKLAMSLARLGQRDAACSSFNELAQRFPDAPAHVKSRAEAERRRARC